MPNIEIHGCSRESGEVKYFEAERLLRDAPFAKHVVINVIGDVVRDLKGYEQPFLRILGVNEADLQIVIDRLKPLGLDCELQTLRAFIPRA